jgi:hypothetical protein
MAVRLRVSAVALCTALLVVGVGSSKAAATGPGFRQVSGGCNGFLQQYISPANVTTTLTGTPYGGAITCSTTQVTGRVNLLGTNYVNSNQVFHASTGALYNYSYTSSSGTHGVYGNPAPGTWASPTLCYTGAFSACGWFEKTGTPYFSTTRSI